MTSSHRRAYIDWARGLAVLLMIEAHTTDAWTRSADKKTLFYRDANILGGFAAPVFLWLAGLAVVLAATRTEERTGSRAVALEAIVRRGLIIFILAFLFRIQGLIVSPGNHIVTIFRVDILNIMGPAIVGAGLAWAIASSVAARVAVLSAIAAALSLVTPIVRASPLVDRLPVAFQWYMRSFGELTVFTLFPWAAFVFAGAAAGALLATARDDRAERRVNAALAIAGAALIVLGFYTASRPSIYAAASFWTSSPTWFAIRVGILMVFLSWLYGLARLVGSTQPAHALQRGGVVRTLATWWQTPLERLGRHSLFIYWIHVELVYGYSSWLWRHRLPMWGTVIAFVLFSVLMYRAIGWRDRVVAFWRARPRGALISSTSSS
jgi:uncharacterized membrane protein